MSTYLFFRSPAEYGSPIVFGLTCPGCTCLMEETASLSTETPLQLSSELLSFTTASLGVNSTPDFTQSYTCQQQP